MVNTTRACVVSLDCPGQELCYMGLPEAPAGTGVCLCNSWFSKTNGPECRDFTPMGVTHVVLAAGLALAAIAALLRVLSDISIAHRELGGVRRIAASTPLIQAAVGLASFASYQLFFIGELNSTLVPSPATGWKVSHPTVAHGGRVSVFFMQVAILMALLSISFRWLEVAENVQAMSPAGTRRISRYKCGIYVTSLVFTGIMLGIAITGHLRLAGFFSTPFLIGLVIAFAVGRRRMVDILSALESDRAGTAKARKFARTITSIEHCSRRVLVAAPAMIVSGILYLAITLAIPYHQCATAGPGGYWCVASFVSKLQPASALLLLLAITAYCHETVANAVAQGVDKLAQAAAESVPNLGLGSSAFESDAPVFVNL